jgi:hypothetical protein
VTQCEDALISDSGEDALISDSVFGFERRLKNKQNETYFGIYILAGDPSN